MEKKHIRTSMIKNIKELSKLDRDKRSKQIIDQLMEIDVWKNADIVATTMPMEHEINTNYLIQSCWMQNKTVVVPKCNHKTREMQFFKIKSFSDLQVGYFGIQEPIEDSCEKISKENIDLIVVPGVAYTIKGDRLGYGGGFYDRYLENYNGDLVSLAYEIQIIETIPTEKHDCSIPIIITETSTIKTSPDNN
ncbi:5-formyltetrahydrofolate cyclo-ligase [Bacillus sp. EAC]|uniref:5-formyltetrahydrofolate cyclo-ligase n=1 Tax=Bacillus sp. EAC TaxID=1978338 RepID=UPI0015C50FD6|nr:5-formyltetrahydrofolate cyclo-ligase [Bacillus sp. EAC]